MNIHQLRGTRSGDVAILGNGPSLKSHPLHSIPSRVDVIGTNQSWRESESDWHVALELAQMWKPGARRVYEEYAKEDMLIVAEHPGTEGAGAWPCGIKVRLLNRTPGCIPFSRDLSRGLYEGIDGVGSVVYAALQVALWLGYAQPGTIYLVGVDLQGNHFDGSGAVGVERQAPLFSLAAQCMAGINVRVVGIDSGCTAWPRIPFPW